MTGKTIWLLLFFSMFLMGADNGDQRGEERGKLLEQQKHLSARVKTLKREQDYLLFQSTMYASDSKYLVLNIFRKSGQLKYKNRILKNFHFERVSVSGRINKLTRGALTLTQKIEGDRKRKLLVFDNALVMQGVHAPATRLESGIPRFSLSKKDFRSVYYALEPGAKVYIML